MKRTILLTILALLILSACSNPQLAPTATTTSLPTQTLVPTETATATPTPDPIRVVLDSQHAPYQFNSNGEILIDLYDTPQSETISLRSETIKKIATTDGLNPRILVAQDTKGNRYALNPDHGWFKIIEIQIDYTKLNEYTEVEQDFIEDGRANITSALRYAENPTISPDAISTLSQYWVNYNFFKRVLSISFFPAGNTGLAQQKYPEEYAGIYYVEENKPFVFSGYYKVRLREGEICYVISRTAKNPTTENPNQTINLFNGFDQITYQKMAEPDSPGSEWSTLRIVFERTSTGTMDFLTILAPPEQLPDGTPIYFDPATAGFSNLYNPILGKNQVRGKLISFFSNEDQAKILEVLSYGYKNNDQSTAPLSYLPKEFAKFILFTTFSAP